MRLLLEAVMDGERGDSLRRTLGVDTLDALEQAFAAQTGWSVYRAATDLLQLAVRTSKVPAPDPMKKR